MTQSTLPEVKYLMKYVVLIIMKYLKVWKLQHSKAAE